jgi:hypothetical protein
VTNGWQETFEIIILQLIKDKILMKKITLFLCLISSAMISHGQSQQKLEEVVYLKSGGVKRGMIMEYVPNTSIKIATHDSLLTYKLDEIAKITRERPLPPPPIPPYGFKYNKGYEGIVELGIIDYPNEDNDLPRFSFNAVNGYQFNPYFAMGLGVGLDVSHTQTSKIYDVPITLDTRIYSSTRRTTPFFALAFGFDQRIEPNDNYYYKNDHPVGFVFAFQTGIRVAINKKAGMSFGIGYRLTTIHYQYFYAQNNQYDIENGGTFRVGVDF